MNLDQAVKDLQEAMTVMAEIEKRQSRMLLEHSERIVNIEALEAEAAKHRARTEQNLAEITDKLNGLIGYIDGMKHPPANPQ